VQDRQSDLQAVDPDTHPIGSGMKQLTEELRMRRLLLLGAALIVGACAGPEDRQGQSGASAVGPRSSGVGGSGPGTQLPGSAGGGINGAGSGAATTGPSGSGGAPTLHNSGTGTDSEGTDDPGGAGMGS
jgi:hypothetical protein